MEPVEIGSGCWIGTGAAILPGRGSGGTSWWRPARWCAARCRTTRSWRAPARVVRRWDAVDGWQPPLRTPAPVPIPDGVTPEQLLALSELDEETVERLAELDAESS